MGEIGAGIDNIINLRPSDRFLATLQAGQVKTSTENREHIKGYIEDYKNGIDEISNALINDEKAVIITGGAKSGKTTTAIAVCTEMDRVLEKKKQQPLIFFTSASAQQTFGAKPQKDETGVSFAKLPPIDKLKEHKGPIVIVIDEVSQRLPLEGVWEPYINLEQTRFMILAHPNSPTTEKWIGLFNGDTQKVSMCSVDELKQLAA